MSLKGFHVFFISVCLIFSVGLGIWALRAYRSTGQADSLYLGVGAFFCGAVLAVYGVWFLRKLRHLSFV